MNTDQIDFSIFDAFLKSRPEVSPEKLKQDLQNYYLPFIEKLLDLRGRGDEGIIVGVSAIQGAGKTTQGEILDILLTDLGHYSISVSIDDHYITHEQLNELRRKDPRFIRRGVTHDIPLAIKNLTDLKKMRDGEKVKIPVYDKGAWDGDGDRMGWKTISRKPDFIVYDGWMLGARRVEDESVFDADLPALETAEAKQFARDINKKLEEYYPLWEMIDFMNMLYVPNYQVSIKWREQAEEVLRQKGEGMSYEEIVEFVHYFWRSVHPAIQIKNLAEDKVHTQQVVVINDDHSIREVKSY